MLSYRLISDIYDETTPDDATIAQEILEEVEAAIKQLEEIDREVIRLRLLDELSNQEVAKALDLSEPAASMRYLRAIRRLRQLIGETVDEDAKE